LELRGSSIVIGSNISEQGYAMSKLPEPNSDPKFDPKAPTKDPDEWVSGDDPMTPSQASYLKTLCEQAGDPIPLIKTSPRPKRLGG